MLRYFLAGAEVVVISDHASMSDGETGLLACVGQGFPTVAITWMHNGQPIPVVSLAEEDVILEGKMFKQSFLQICSAELADAGGYTCVVSNGETSVNSSTQLAVDCKYFSSIMN